MSLNYEQFCVNKDSILLHERTSFTWLPKDKVLDYVQINKFVKQESVDKFMHFFSLYREDLNDMFYIWDWNGGPLSGRGGVCIMRYNRPTFYYLTWLS